MTRRGRLTLTERAAEIERQAREDLGHDGIVQLERHFGPLPFRAHRPGRCWCGPVHTLLQAQDLNEPDPPAKSLPLLARKQSVTGE